MAAAIEESSRGGTPPAVDPVQWQSEVRGDPELPGLIDRGTLGRPRRSLSPGLRTGCLDDAYNPSTPAPITVRTRSA